MNTNEEEQQDFTNEIIKVVEDAAPHRVRLDTTIAEKNKGVMTEYIHMKMNSVPYIGMICAKKRKDRTPEEKEELKEWMKNTKAEYKALKAFLYPTNPMARPMESLAQKISLVVQMLRYLGVTDFDQALAVRGMRIDAPTLEETSPYWTKKETKDVAKDIFDQARDVSVEEMNEKTAITEVQYDNLPEEVVFSPGNKGGLTKGQFSRMVKTKAIALMKTSEEFTAYKAAQLEKDEGTLKSQEIVVETTKEI